MQQRRALGRGLESLLPPQVAPLSPSAASPPTVGTGDGYRKISIDKVVPNRQQPRTVFDEAKIRELAESIKEEGVLQPLIVSKLPDGRYELIAGERRLRASRLAGLAEIPVVIKDVDQEDLLVLSIVENVQREDLNPIEEAMAYQELVDRYHYSQEEIAKRMGKSRAAVANDLRLLKLPRAVQEDVANGRYTAGHARALLGLHSLHEQLKLRETIIQSMPTVRDVETMVQQKNEGERSKKTVRSEKLSQQDHEMQEKLKQVLGTKVQFKPGKNGAGKVIIEYYTHKEFDRIMRRILA